MSAAFDAAAMGPERALFVRIGSALYGEQWQEAIARDLGVSGRSVRYWLAGRHAIPPGLWGELRALIVARQKELGEIVDRLT
jgi:hypothetical protein